MTPHIPVLRPSVQQEQRLTLPGFSNMKLYASHLDKAMFDSLDMRERETPLRFFTGRLTMHLHGVLFFFSECAFPHSRRYVNEGLFFTMACG
jgi:hypothetical protein